MKELAEWLERLRPEASDSTDNPIMLRRVLHRLAAPSDLAFESPVLESIPAGAEQSSIGSLPERLCLLAWSDRAAAGGTVHDMTVAGQIGAAFTLATGRRIRVASSEINVRHADTDQHHFIPAVIADRDVSGPVPEQAQSLVEALLAQILGLSAKDREVIGNAIELHSAAVQVLLIDLNAAYALCVAGLETLAVEYGSADTSWERWDQAARFDSAFDAAGLSDDQRESMRAALLDRRHLGLRQRFATYIGSRLPSAFWDEAIQTFTPSLVIQPNGEGAWAEPAQGDDLPIVHFVPSDAIALRSRLLASYDARSTYVHAGGRAVSFGSALSAAVGHEASPKTPIDIVGLRRILVALIRRELEERSAEVDLPEILFGPPER